MLKYDNLCLIYIICLWKSCILPPTNCLNAEKNFVKPLDLGLHGFSREIHTNTYTIERSQIIICFVSLKNNGYTLQIYGRLSNDIWIFFTQPPTEMQIKVDSRLF